MTAASETQQVCTLLFSRTSNAGILASNMQFLIERESVFLALHLGDIFAAHVGQQDGPVEPELVVTKLLALVTGEARLLLKTQDFDVVDEFPLALDQQCEEAPVVLGGVKRETQYYNKAGKAAAQGPWDFVTRNMIAYARMDDGQARISWCSDSAFIAVSFAAQSGARELRVFLW
ncbi:putative elongator complex protein 1 [Coemansia furcata]|uniref:Elongator complex protein 1 n=1 Tax=Coemansia furcata TaxID=417177 RepID=A0ACC1LA67_9FUNG|nr:putative elongator complex protein 1 [Coemansia furcata]